MQTVEHFEVAIEELAGHRAVEGLLKIMILDQNSGNEPGDVTIDGTGDERLDWAGGDIQKGLDISRGQTQSTGRGRSRDGRPIWLWGSGWHFRRVGESEKDCQLNGEKG